MAAGLAMVAVGGAQAAVVPGTPYPGVHFGLDNDNANNTFIQPPGVTAKQHMENTDVLFGRGGDDLLIGRLGSDTILGNEGRDILVGGPEGAPNPPGPNSDVLIGDQGSDINLWAPGDGSEVFIGDEDANRKDVDVMVFAPFRFNPTQKLSTYGNRKIPMVKIDEQTFTCTLDKLTPTAKDGTQFLARFRNAQGGLIVTVRLKDVEHVFCPSTKKGYAKVAYLDAKVPAFKEIPFKSIANATLYSIFTKTS
jgi:RTX calcium-binding nonapeptide repeat (4 copies)